jgi:hypothetical protein
MALKKTHTWPENRPTCLIRTSTVFIHDTPNNERRSSLHRHRFMTVAFAVRYSIVLSHLEHGLEESLEHTLRTRILVPLIVTILTLYLRMMVDRLRSGSVVLTPAMTPPVFVFHINIHVDVTVFALLLLLGLPQRRLVRTIVNVIFVEGNSNTISQIAE